VSGSEVLTLEQSAAVAGHARWLETRLFEVLGGWVTVEADAAVKVLWSTLSLRHAAHAAGWSDRQPRLAHLGPETLIVAAGPDIGALVEALAAITAPDATVPRLAAVGRVVEPRLLDAYRSRAERAHPLADGPTLRWTSVLLADGETAVAGARALLAPRLRTADDAEAARICESALAGLVAGRGAIIGLTPPVDA
jgi:hypothetical protein